MVANIASQIVKDVIVHRDEEDREPSLLMNEQDAFAFVKRLRAKIFNPELIGLDEEEGVGIQSPQEIGIKRQTHHHTGNSAHHRFSSNAVPIAYFGDKEWSQGETLKSDRHKAIEVN